MAVPVARVHLKLAHASLPALLPTPPKWKTMLPLLPMLPGVAILAKPSLAKPPSRADSDERWDARKAKPLACLVSSASSSSRPRKNPTSPLPKCGRADSVERWDAHKKAAARSTASSSSSSGTSSLASSSSKWPISRRASSAERWDVHKKRRPAQAQLLDDDDGERSSTGSNDDINTEEEDEDEEILWKPRGMYAGPGFVGAAPEPSMLPMPTSFLPPVA